jgi:hypothetical protein
MWEVMISYVIMHRTIVESKPDDLSTIKIGNFMASWLGPREEDIVTIVTALLNPWPGTNFRNQNDLVDHMWNHVGTPP